jgi:carboxyl-terminal processing protease
MNRSNAGPTSLRPATLVAVLISMVSGIVIGAALHVHVRNQHPIDPELHAFEHLLKEIHDNYVEPRSEDELLGTAIEGVMSGLDPHSEFLDERALADLSELTTGQFGGIGVELADHDGAVTVVAPLDDTPAQRAGLAPGDVLERIDGKSFQGSTLNDASDALRGAPGTSVALGVRRSGHTGLLEFDIVRAAISVASVRSRALEPGYGYVRISQFQNNTGPDLIGAISTLQARDGPLRGLILDLRNNPGGVLQASVEVADAFLSDGDGLIVYTKGRQPSADLKFVATGIDLLRGAPLVVMINRGSASAAEIVAGALQDHKRALIVGSTSYGKGSVQAVLPLEDHHALKLTTALYFTPSGRSIQSKGIRPDIEFDADAPVNGASDTVLTAALAQLKSIKRG